MLPIILVVQFMVLVAASPASNNASTDCRDPPVRKEWRALSQVQQKSYIDAVLCLQDIPAKSGFESAKNRFDDFQAIHSNQTPEIHWVVRTAKSQKSIKTSADQEQGHFILWHRYFVATYEKSLREECGYQGGQPYWDWSLDASATNNDSTAIYETAIFDSTYGFGGNGPYVEATSEQNPLNITGHTGGGCVMTGPFTFPRFKINVPSTGCLKRDFTPWIMNYFAQQALVDHVLSQPDYTSFAFAIENVPSFDQPNIHGSGHFGVGGVLGTIGDAYNSPGDPLFYLHHGNLDRILWEWQSKDLAVRLNQVGGPVTPFDYGGKNVTLDFEVNIGALAGNATLHDLLNPLGDTLCYTY